MQKFLVLFNAPSAAMDAMMKISTPEQKKAGMDEWKQWMEKNKASFIDTGAPVGKNLRVTASGATAVRNDVGGYSIMQAESAEALVNMLKGFGHFEIPEAYIEVMPLADMSKI